MLLETPIRRSVRATVGAKASTVDSGAKSKRTKSSVKNNDSELSDDEESSDDEEESEASAIEGIS